MRWLFGFRTRTDHIGRLYLGNNDNISDGQNADDFSGKPDIFVNFVHVYNRVNLMKSHWSLKVLKSWIRITKNAGGLQSSQLFRSYLALLWTWNTRKIFGPPLEYEKCLNWKMSFNQQNKRSACSPRPLISGVPHSRMQDLTIALAARSRCRKTSMVYKVSATFALSIQFSRTTPAAMTDRPSVRISCSWTDPSSDKFVEDRSEYRDSCGNMIPPTMHFTGLQLSV